MNQGFDHSLDGTRSDVAKAELILRNCLRHVDGDSALMRAVYPMALANLTRAVAEYPEDFRLKNIGPEQAKPPTTLPPPPMPRELLRTLELPAAPMVLGRLNQAMSGHTASADEIADIVRLEPTLAASLLRMVNSPFYAVQEPVETVSRAVVVLGTKQTYLLAMGDIATRAARSMRPQGMDTEAFWEHSVACAVLARELAVLSGAGMPESLFVAGLLHDIGRLALYAALPGHSRMILHLAATLRTPRLRQEQEILGYDHAYLGGGLLRTWNIPESIVQGVGFHHAPMQAKALKRACTVHLADILAQMFMPRPSALTYAAPLSLAAWETLDIDPEQLAETLASLEETVDATLSVLLPDRAGNEK